jgi:hypothetical protein
VKHRATLLVAIPFAAALAAGLTSGVASAKPGPPPSVAEGHITADQQHHPCLTAASTHPGARVNLAPCTSRLNATQRWKVARYKAVIVMGLAANPGSCLSAVPQTVKIKGKVFHYAHMYDCGRGIELPPGGTLLGHIGGIYNTIIQAHGGRLLSAPNKAGSGRGTQWLHSSGNIPFTQVWLFPKFKPI